MEPSSDTSSALDDTLFPVRPERNVRDERQQDRLWSPLFIFIVIMTLCCFMVGQGLNSGTSVYIAHLGGTTAYAGMLAAVFSIAAALTRVACGPLVDKRGRWSVMMIGMGFLLVGTLVPALTTDMTVFLLCRFLQGIGFSAATTASATAAADVLPLSRLGEGIGYYGLGQALAMSVGPALALFLVSTDPAQNLFIGLATIAALGLATTALCRYERNPTRLPATATYRRRAEEAAHEDTEFLARKADAPDSHTSPPSQGQAAHCDAGGSAASPQDDQRARAFKSKKNVHHLSTQTDASDTPSKKNPLFDVFEPRALPGTLPMLVLSPAFGFGIFFVGLYGTTLGLGNAGLFYTLSAVSMIAVRLKSKSFMDRVAPLKVFTWAIAAGLVCYGLLFAAPASELLYYAAGIFYGICIGIAMPLNQSVSVKNTPPERWGATNALFFLATDLGIGCASVLWGLLNDSCGFAVTILCVIGCIVASYGVAWITYPREKQHRRQHRP